MKKHLPKFGRYSLLFHFMIWFLMLSQILRFTFFIWQYNEVSWNIIDLIRTLFTGLFFDIGTITFISLASIVYYTIIPNRFIGSFTDKILVCFFTSLTTFILVFT